ncbi:hypothetical protein ZWY2020_038011 [Hordeum vulgare]|nr:hypothetical protein ZWY2020_038011 [Hordeum vulgare]
MSTSSTPPSPLAAIASPSPRSKQVNISVTCPSHGISIGSLGRYKDEKDVTDIHVKNCVFKGSTNGLRIKSYEDSKSPLVASKISYENIKMDDSGYPIIIDQKYCPNKLCTAKGDSSRVTVKDVTFKNITGTSSTPEAVSLLASAKSLKASQCPASRSSTPARTTRPWLSAPTSKSPPRVDN